MQMHLERILLYTEDIYIKDALFGSSSFGISFVSVASIVVAALIIASAFLNLLKRRASFLVLILVSSALLFCLIASQNPLYGLQYGFMPFVYLSSIEPRISFFQRVFNDTNLTKEAIFITYGIGAYMALFICAGIAFLAFLGLASRRQGG